MWYCTKCGVQNEDDSKFCYKCGQEKPEQVYEGDNTATTVAEKKSDKNKTKIIGAIIVAAVAIIAFALISFAKDYMITKDPINRIFYGYSKLYEADTIDTDVNISLEFVEYPDQSDANIYLPLLEDLDIDFNMKADNKDNKFIGKINLNFDGNSIIDSDIYGDKEVFAFNIPFLLEEWVYIDYEKVYSNNGNIDYDEISEKQEAYSELLEFDNIDNWKEVKKDYGTFMSDILNKYVEKENEKVTVELLVEGETKTIDCEEVVVNMEVKDLFTIYLELLEKAKNDERIKEILIYKLNQFLELAKENGDADLMAVDGYELEEIIKALDEEYDYIIEELIKEIEFVKDGLQYEEAELYITWRFRFDNNHILRNLLADIIIEQNDPYYTENDFTMKLKSNMVVNSINEKTDINKPDLSGGYDFASDPEGVSQKIEQDMQYNLMKNLMSNPELLYFFSGFDF